MAIGIIVPEALSGIKARLKPADFAALKSTLKRYTKRVCKDYRKTHRRSAIAADFRGVWNTVVRCLEAGDPLIPDHLAYGDERVSDTDRDLFFGLLCKKLNENAEFFIRDKLQKVLQNQEDHDAKSDRHQQEVLERLDKVDQTLAQGQAAAPAPSPRWLTQQYRRVSEHYIDRPELDDLKTALQTHTKLLLCGMGGLGKTELMRKACAELEETYQTAAWIQYAGSLRGSMTSQITADGLNSLPDSEKFEAIFKLLSDAGRGLLLCVDNVDADAVKDRDLSRLHTLPGTVILTARPSQVLAGFHPVEVRPFDEDACKRLFYAYAGLQEPLADETELEKIIGLAGFHTLVLEILARIIRVRGMSVSELLQKLRDKNFNIPVPVLTAHSEDVPEDLPTQLEKLYDISQVKENSLYVRILKNFSILPYLSLSKEDAAAFLALNEAQENALFDLDDMGWLERSNDGFAMHPVVRQAMQKEKATLEDCRGFIRKLLNAAMIDYFQEIKYLPHIAAVAECFQEEDALVGQEYNDLSVIYKNLGWQPEALEWQMKAVKIMGALYPDGKHPDLATSYNNLSLIHQDMGHLPEALEWQMKALKIREALYPDGKHPDLATSYNNLASIHKNMGHLLEALEWQMKDMKITEASFLDGIHPDLATSYSNLSTIYRAMGHLPEALEWQMKAFKIMEALYPGGKHPALATSYNNLSMIHQVMDQLPEALEYQKRAIKILTALFPDGIYPNLAISYGNLSIIYKAMGSPGQAEHWEKEAARVRKALRKRDEGALAP